MQVEGNIIRDKSYSFARRVVRLEHLLREERKEYVLSKQFLRSGTAVGALVREGEFAQSKADFINKFHIALKEANETDYWIDLLKDGGYISEEEHQSISRDCKELLRILIAIINSAKAEKGQQL